MVTTTLYIVAHLLLQLLVQHVGPLHLLLQIRHLPPSSGRGGIATLRFSSPQQEHDGRSSLWWVGLLWVEPG